VTLALLATLACLAVPRLTSRLGRFETPTVDVETNREQWVFENPFAPADEKKEQDADSGTSMPTAEAVWTKVKSASVTRAALLAGFAAGVAVDLTLLLRSGVEVYWPVFAFVLACAAVLALRIRTFDTWFERAALAAPAVAIIVVACVLAQGGVGAIPLTAMGVLLAVAVIAALAGLTVSGGTVPQRLATLLSYLDYLAVGSLIPLALWVLGVYQRSALW
jgi:hypothetical protein